jgi:hypothetical protein
MGCTSAIGMPAASAAAKCLPFLLIGALVPVVVSGCINGQPASDTGDPGFPFGPSSVGTQPLAYVQDIKPILDRDCLSCHRSNGAEGGYSVSTYADVLAGQRPGDAKSSLVVTCAPGGSMYGYLRGDALTSATMIFRWLVYYNGAQTR